MLKDDQGRRICFQCRKPNITCRCWPYQGFWVTLSWGAMQDLLEDVDAKARALARPKEPEAEKVLTVSECLRMRRAHAWYRAGDPNTLMESFRYCSRCGMGGELYEDGEPCSNTSTVPSCPGVFVRVVPDPPEEPTYTPADVAALVHAARGAFPANTDVPTTWFGPLRRAIAPFIRGEES